VTDPVPLSTVSVTVHVLDMNDNSPQFHAVTPRLVHLGHSVPVGSRVAQMLATDDDTGHNGRILYQFDTGLTHFVASHSPLSHQSTLQAPD